MRFDITKKPHPNLKRYHGEDFTFATKFAHNIQKELGEFLKAVVLFGSSVRPIDDGRNAHDIDLLLVVNDLTIVASPEVITAYRVIVDNTAAKVSKRLHINTMKMTSMWDYARNGDPLLINILRDGVPLYDTGFFEPMQALLGQGRIRPTKEAVWAYYGRAPLTLRNAEKHLLQAAIDLYWACVDSAHAALMHMGQTPGLPSHVPRMISEHLVKKKLVHRSAPGTMEFFFKLQKDINKREKRTVTGKEFDKWRQEAKSFVQMMKEVISK